MWLCEIYRTTSNGISKVLNGNCKAWYATDGENWPSTQTYAADKITNSPMMATGTVGGEMISPLSFKNMGGLLRLNLKGTAKITSVKISANEYMSGKFNGEPGPGEAAVIDNVDTKCFKSITLDCGAGVTLNESTATSFYIAMPANTTGYTGVTIELTDDEGKVCTKTFKGASGLKIERSKITSATFTVGAFTAAPIGALSGKFSVSDTKQVYFSKGNLYYDGSAFKFEENQYDYVSSWNSSHVSLFYWSKSTSVACSQQYSDPSRAEGDVLFTNATEETPNADFTVNEQTGMWRSLSNDEWGYLLGTSSKRDGKYKLGVTVIDKNGLVIAPDDFSDTIAESYDSSEWAEAEANGLVLLPTGGWNYNGGFSHAGSTGCVWSSSYDRESNNNPYHIQFYSESSLGIDKAFSEEPKTACSIRLVTNVK